MRANNQLRREIKKSLKFHNKKAFEHVNTSRLTEVKQTTDPLLINAVILFTSFALFLSTHLVILLTIIPRYEIECVQYRSLIRTQLDTLRVEKKKDYYLPIIYFICPITDKKSIVIKNHVTRILSRTSTWFVFLIGFYTAPVINTEEKLIRQNMTLIRKNR